MGQKTSNEKIILVGEDTWFDFMERMKDIECVWLTQLLIDDLQQFNGILVKEEILKSAMFEFDRFKIY